MSTHPRPLDEQAAAWLCERDEGFAPGRAEAFAAWCAADPGHAAAVRQIERAMAVLETMPTVRRPLEARFGPLDSAPVTVEVSAETSALLPPSSALRAVGSHRALIAAMAAVVFALCGWWYFAAQIAGREYFVNETAAPRQIALRDGSIVHLDARAALRVDFSGHDRRVRLEAGQAHFEVAHDATHPFIATAAGVAVRAIGTAFSVRLASTAVEVLVEEGRVEVAPATPAPVDAAVPAAPAPQLGAGERAVVARADVAAQPQIKKVEAPELREALAWHRRTVVLEDVPLAEVIARFNRRNAVQLVVADEDLRDRRVGGVLALDQVEAFVALLERGGDVVAERRGPEEIVLRRAR
ncbi:MAG: FecR domain-containing protein [Opitutaceae bacterium]|nr:FecR domain-containing protein [Opitutaceae bacterium]